METFISTQSVIFQWVILPLLIFSARIIDVSLGTIKLIFISRGYKKLAPILGFIEVLVWIIAITQIMKNLNNPLSYFAWAAGFAIGTYVGMWLENKLALGNVILRIITKENADELVMILRARNYGVTHFDAEGINGRVKIIFMVLDRQDLPSVIELIRRYHPNVFYTIEDVREVNEGTFPKRFYDNRPTLLFPFSFFEKKGK
ncbi:MAG: DUF2179 domain-containing protein [bacterium]|nr:DUF2179 domain-containing protein [bacterium]